MISISRTASARASGSGAARRVGKATTTTKGGSSPIIAIRPSRVPLAIQPRDADKQAMSIITSARRGAASNLVPRAGANGTLSRGAGGNNAPQQIDEPPLTADSYVCVGLATCFERDDTTGKLAERLVVEPISASSLECMANGARTSFRFAAGTTLGALMRGGGTGSNNPSDALPEEYRGAALCANWARRVEAAARTWQRPHAQDHLMDIAPLPAKGSGPKARGGFNFSLDDKRVLNSVNVVTDADNVKQDISIDVYGRAEAEAAAKAEMEEEELGAQGGEGESDGDAHERAEAARARATAPCEHMGRPADDDSSDEEDELDALLAA
jgi:phosphatidylinositol glycan class S